MRYKTLLDYDQSDKLLDEIKDHLIEGLWLIDLDPRADQVLIGPYDSVAEAHDARDYIWHYGDKYGRYLWHMTHKNCQRINNLLGTIDDPATLSRPYIELEIDTIPLEIIGVRFIYGSHSIKFPKPTSRKKTI